MLIQTRQSLNEKATDIKGRVLTISCYQPTLKVWHMLLEAYGFDAVSFVGIDGLEALNELGPFNVIVLGQSVPDTDKKILVPKLRQVFSAPIISVPSSPEELLDGADFHIEPDPEELLKLLFRLVGKKQPVPIS